MFERSIRHGHDQFVWRLAVRFNNDRSIFAFRRIEQRSKPIERDLLIAEINRRDCAASNADDLLVLLRAEQKRRGRRRNPDPRLQNKVRAQEQEKNQEKDNVDQGKDNEPAEIVFLRPA